MVETLAWNYALKSYASMCNNVIVEDRNNKIDYVENSIVLHLQDNYQARNDVEFSSDKLSAYSKWWGLGNSDYSLK